MAHAADPRQAGPLGEGAVVANFTPGPWSFYLDPEGYYAIKHESEAHEPGDVAHIYIPGSTDPEYDDGNEGLANAQLIAAAPAMFEALKEIDRLVSGGICVVGHKGKDRYIRLIGQQVDAALNPLPAPDTSAEGQ